MSSNRDFPEEVSDGVMRSYLAEVRRVVVKVGSQVLSRTDGSVDEVAFSGLCQAISSLHRAGRQVVLVSSGAVALGRGVVGQVAGAADKGTGRLGKQSMAAIGQSLLMSRYRDQFLPLGIDVAQVLLTHSDLGHRRRFLHARRVTTELLSAGVLPIVNENDTVAVDEIRFGDNDTLAAQVAHLVGAGALILLTEVDGLFTADPAQDSQAQLLRAVSAQDDRIVAIATSGSGRFGTGGMRSKVLAAQMAAELGITAVVANGRRSKALIRVLEGEEEGTVFISPGRRLTGKRKWILASVRTNATVHVDAGATEALCTGGKSLLPIGVTRIEGRFEVGDAVVVLAPDGSKIGVGLSRYDSGDATRVLGLKTVAIASVLGWLPAPELIHRDDFVTE